MGQTERVATPFDQLTYNIIGCAMASHRKLGPGYREDTYQRDLGVQFAEAGIHYEAQKLYSVYDRLGQGSLIGFYIPDFVVDEKVIVEIKALRGLDNSHLAQIIGYLAVSGLGVGLLINFWRQELAIQKGFSAQRCRRTPG